MNRGEASVAHDGAPSWLLLGAEPLRAALEFAGVQLMNKSALPRGEIHPVVLFPGLASDALALKPLQRLCEGLGYPAVDWGRGFNTGPEGDLDAWLGMLSDEVVELTAAHEAAATLIGWSLGGIYAREVAKRLSRRVRQVITIGTPFAGTPAQTHATLVYRLLNGRAAPSEQRLRRRLLTPPPVPTTSIYSRSDGIVAWQACVQPGGHPLVENVEVSGSHCGLGWNSDVFRVVADRLAQPVDRWRPYAAPGWTSSTAAPVAESGRC